MAYKEFDQLERRYDETYERFDEMEIVFGMHGEDLLTRHRGFNKSILHIFVEWNRGVYFAAVLTFIDSPRYQLLLLFSLENLRIYLL